MASTSLVLGTLWTLAVSSCVENGKLNTGNEGWCHVFCLHVLQDGNKEWDSSQRDLDAKSMHRQLVALRHQAVQFSALKYFFNLLLLNHCVECSIPWLLVCTHGVFETVNKHASLTISHPAAGINFPCPFRNIFGIPVLFPLSENPCDSWQPSTRNLVIGIIKSLLGSWQWMVNTWIPMKGPVGLIRRIMILKTTWTTQWNPVKN